ncbi:MAG TPA: glutathione S-transferase [Burkholderiaceae bacterium]|nr:glutathione S-transferase [Burkholderiaceae bacterium]
MATRLKLHWSPKSPYVRKVMICAHELGLQDRLELVRSVAAMLKPNPAIMADNPLSKIPTLVLDDGTALFDSSVICQYLNELAQGSLIAATGPARWQALRWEAFGDGLLDVLILWRNEREREHPMQVLTDAFELKTRAALKRLESEVQSLDAATFDLGHVSICCALGYLDYRFDALGWRKEAPGLARWYADMQKRPSVRSTEPADG